MENRINIKKETRGSLAFLKKDLNITPKKLRANFWLFCTIIWLVLYWKDNGSFAEFFAPLNLFIFGLLAVLITESIVFIHHKVKTKSKNGFAVILSSITGIALGISLTIAVCFSLF